jgi:hypothetical protein
MPWPSGFVLEEHPLLEIRFWFPDSDAEFEETVWNSLKEVGIGIPPFTDDPFRHQQEWLNPEAIRGITWILDHLTEPAAAIAALKVTKDIVLAWIKANSAREIRVSIKGKDSINVKGHNDIDKCISALERLQRSHTAAMSSTKRTTTKAKKSVVKEPKTRSARSKHNEE